MADTTINTGSAQKKYWNKYFAEYVRDSGFQPYMSSRANSPFVVKRELITGGKEINIPLVSALNGSGVGTNSLDGNEEALDNYSYNVKPIWHRNAVSVQKSEQHKSAIDLYKAADEALKNWDADELRDGIIYGLDAIAEDDSAYNEGTGAPKQVNYADATATQRNTYAAANEKRLLFGDSTSNYNATFATAAANITTAMTLGAAEITLMKRMAKARDRANDIPSVRPIRVDGGREYFVMFVPSNIFASIKDDTTIANANREARARDMSSNPIFQDGDLIYDGVIITEIPEITSTGTIGASAANVAPAYLSGAQALGVAYGQDQRLTIGDNTDYDFIRKVGTESLWAAEKLFYNGLQHGMVTGYFHADTLV